LARARIPTAKAEVSGAAAKNPQRFTGRQKPTKPRSLGKPYAMMTDAEVWYWQEFTNELPWLNSSHRAILRMACVLSAKMDTEKGLVINEVQALSSILSKLGATPADESKVNHNDSDEEDPADKFFGRPH